MFQCSRSHRGLESANSLLHETSLPLSLPWNRFQETFFGEENLLLLLKILRCLPAPFLVFQSSVPGRNPEAPFIQDSSVDLSFMEKSILATFK